MTVVRAAWFAAARPAGKLLAAFSLLAIALALPAAAEEPVVEASPEAIALAARAAALQHGPRALAGEPQDVPLRVVVGGRKGAAAVAIDLVLHIEAGGRGVRFEGSPAGDAARIGRIANKAAHLGVDAVVAGGLPYPWDSWKGSVDESGALRAVIRKEGEREIGLEVELDEKGLPTAGWTLLPGKDGVLAKNAWLQLRWEPVGKLHRLVETTHEIDGRVIASCRYEWGPAEELLPRRWTVVVEDRVTRFARRGHEAPAPDVGPVMGYYLDPQPERFVELLKKTGDKLLAPTGKDSDQGDLLAVMLAGILRAEPERINPILEDLAKSGPGPGRVLVRAVALAADANLERSLEEIRPTLHESIREECDRVKGGLPRPLESAIPMDAIPAGPAALDRCWYLWCASGDPAALRPIVGALRGLDSKKVPALLTGGAARWSLVSNCRQMPGVRECLERDLAEVPKELLPHLKVVLEKASEDTKATEPEKDEPK